jgi:hypothetical protein
MNELHDTCDKCCAVLERTNDGDDLDPKDLHLTECAVNGFLTEAGLRRFNELHRRVLAGEYVKPWFHGVEPMTHDHEGYVYYKDMHVEHYSSHYAYSLEAKRDLTELRNQCAYLEKTGAEVSCANAVWGWKKYADAYASENRAALDRALDGAGLTYSKIIVDNNWNNEIEFFVQGVPDWEDIRKGPEFQDFYNRSDHDHGFEVSVRSYRYGGEKEADGAEALACIPSCHDWLRENGLLREVKAQNYVIEPERENEDEAAGSEDDDEEEYGQ